MRTMTTDVAIIGAGVIGCAVAFNLAKKGIETVVLEADVVAAEGSGRSMGALRSQGRHLTELEYAIESSKILPTLNDEFGYDTEYRRGGHIMLVYSEEYVTTLKAIYERQNGYGHPVSKMISPEEVYKLVPTLPEGIAGGLYCPTDGQVNPVRMTKGYSLGARKWGAKIVTHAPVKKLNISGGRVVSVDAGDLTVKANKVVNVTGIHAGEISKSVGINLPIKCLIYELIISEPLPPFLTPVLQSPQKAFGLRQSVNGNLVFGSSVPNDLTYDVTVTREKFRERLNLMKSICPKTSKEISIIRSFSGLYDITPDLVPIVDSFENPRGYFVVAGFSGHGLAIGPSMGKQVADWISTGKSSLDLSRFRLSRFSEKDLSEWEQKKGLYSFHSWPKPKAAN